MVLTKYKRKKDGKVFTLEWLWKTKDKNIAYFIGEDNRETKSIKDIITSEDYELISGEIGILVALNPDNNQISICEIW